ncbi:MAG: GIY-YIG nuclease family protein [Ruminococcus sp.]|nr:GIY-YIG nuclease family protein [Ruminococcus sp.]
MNGLNIFLILFLIIETIGFGLFYYKSIKPQKQEEQKQHQDEFDKIYQIQKEINELSSQKTQLLQDITKEKQEVEQIYEKEKNKLSEQINLYKSNLSYASEQYVYHLEQKYKEVEKEYHIKVQQLEQQEQKQKDIIQQYIQKIDNLKDTLNAGARAQLREREKEEQLSFYKLSVSESDLDDILKLNNLKLSFHQPVILSKLIWSTYFQKQTTEMCNRILGTTNKVCGIYKITNIKTQQCYIGQSVDVAQRWKDHVKCGLGIEASATNKLYNSMQRDGVWNFTFELMEQCDRPQLNEKEAFWIEMYQAYDLGFNSTKGNK